MEAQDEIVRLRSEHAVSKEIVQTYERKVKDLCEELSAKIQEYNELNDWHRKQGEELELAWAELSAKSVEIEELKKDAERRRAEATPQLRLPRKDEVLIIDAGSSADYQGGQMSDREETLKIIHARNIP